MNASDRDTCRSPHDIAVSAFPMTNDLLFVSWKASLPLWCMFYTSCEIIGKYPSHCIYQLLSWNPRGQNVYKSDISSLRIIWLLFFFKACTCNFISPAFCPPLKQCLPNYFQPPSTLSRIFQLFSWTTITTPTYLLLLAPKQHINHVSQPFWWLSE